MDFYLFQSVEQPTRSNNYLDLVLTNTPSFMFEPKTGPQFRESGLSSDHFPVSSTLLWMLILKTFLAWSVSTSKMQILSYLNKFFC